MEENSFALYEMKYVVDSMTRRFRVRFRLKKHLNIYRREIECRSYVKHRSNWTAVHYTHWLFTQTLGPPTLLLRAGWGDASPQRQLL